MRVRVIFLLALSAVAAGCHPLPAGRLDAVAPISTAPRRGTVYLIRGWRDLYSAGVDQLADELRRAGVHAQTYRAAQWPDLAGAIATRYPAGPAPEPLVLVGFSYGADDTLRVAEQIQLKGIPVDLVVTIDPVTPPAVPDNVRRCCNFFQTNGVWDVFPWLRGIPLRSLGDPARLTNVNLRRSRPDLLEPDTAHSNIAANPKLHRAVVGLVLDVCPPRTETESPVAKSKR